MINATTTFDGNTYTAAVGALLDAGGVSRFVQLFVNGTDMGASSSATDKADIALRVHGTDLIAYVEILRFQPGDKAFKVVQRYTPKAMDFETIWNDSDTKPGSIYYTRIQQQSTVHGRMAYMVLYGPRRKGGRPGMVSRWSTPVRSSAV